MLRAVTERNSGDFPTNAVARKANYLALSFTDKHLVVRILQSLTPGVPALGYGEVVEVCLLDLPDIGGSPGSDVCFSGLSNHFPGDSHFCG